VNGFHLSTLKREIEALPHLKPVLFGGFNPKKGKDLYDTINLVAGYVNRISRMNGGHLYVLFVYFPENEIPFLPKLHSHFIILSDTDIPSKIYRAARRRAHGFFHIEKYNSALGGIPYLYAKHKEVRFGDVFCRNGRKCRCKNIHREFDAALKGMYIRCSV